MVLAWSCEPSVWLAVARGFYLAGSDRSRVCAPCAGTVLSSVPLSCSFRVCRGRIAGCVRRPRRWHVRSRTVALPRCRRLPLVWGRCADPEGPYTGAKIAYQSFPDAARLRWLGVVYRLRSWQTNDKSPPAGGFSRLSNGTDWASAVEPPDPRSCASALGTERVGWAGSASRSRRGARQGASISNGGGLRTYQRF